MDVSSLNSAYADYYSQLASNANASALANKLNSTDTQALANKLNSADAKNATDDELMEVCKEFESYLMEQVFKNMQKTVSIFNEDADSSTNQLVDYFKDQTIQELASTATEQNSVGLAQILYDQLKINMGVTPEQLAQNNAESGTVTEK